MLKIIVLFWSLFIISGCNSHLIALTPNRKEVFVKKGDTLYSLAKENNVDLNEIAVINNLDNTYKLRIGQRLVLPKTHNNIYHIVQKKETLYSISKRYSISLDELAKINNIHPPYTLKIGQTIVLKKPSKITTQKVFSEKKVFLPKSKKTFIWPVKGKIISDYGKKGQGQQNDGINILAPLGTEVVASEKGTVVYAHNQLKGYGNLILIHHANGWITTYAHLNKMYVSKGMKVNKGQKIATVGHTGSVKSPQLHFEIRYNTKVVNPKKYLQ